MPTSSRYRELSKRIGVLERRLPRPNPTGVYAAKQYDAVLAFRLLAHAEVEACLEDISKAAVLDAFRGFQLDGRARLPLIAVTSYAQAGKLAGASDPSAVDFGHFLANAVTEHGRRVSANNGIREKNVASLLLPAGLQLSEIDPLWLTEIDAFGRRRGDAAHQSLGTQQPPDPVSERASVRFVVRGLRPIDARLLDLSK